MLWLSIVFVDLTKIDGSAFSVMASVSKALRRNGVSKEEIDQYKKESMSGNYNHLIQTAMKYVNVA